MFPELHGIVGIDTETSDPYLKTWGPGWARADGGRIIGISISTEQESYYYPISHNTEGNIDKDQVVRWLRCQFAKDTVTFVFFNAMYDLGWLSTLGLPFPKRYECTMIASSLLNENLSNYSLDYISELYLGEKKDEALLESLAKQKNIKDYKAHLAEFHPSLVAPYAKQDAQLPRKLWYKFEKFLKEPPEIYDLVGLIGIREQELYAKADYKLWDCYRNLEMELLPVLFDMRKRGVRVDLDRNEQVIEEFNIKQDELVKQIHHLTGVVVSPTNTASYIPVLKHLGLEMPKTKTGKDSANKKFIEGLLTKAEEHSLGDNAGVLQTLLDLSGINKALTGFLIPMRDKFAVNGRVHSTFNQVPTSQGAKDKSGARTGRMSSTNPNLQNQPSRNKLLKKAIRSIYLPEEGCRWGSFDYSQQELRMMVHFATKRNLTGAETVAERYRNDKNLDFHSLTAEMANISRSHAKTINFGLGYGLGQANLCKSLGFPTKVKLDRNGSPMYDHKGLIREEAGEDGKKVIESYYNAFPFSKELMKVAEQRARKLGFVRTLLGRHCRFETIVNEFGITEYSKLFRAVNKVIQGSSADQTKKAMIELHKAGLSLLLSVHDDNCVNIQHEEQLYQTKDIMENCIQLVIPVKVDVHVGPDWGNVENLQLS